MRNYLLLALTLFYAASGFAAEPYHISDELQAYMHSGPSNRYRIIARPESGSPVTVLERNRESGYVKIRTEAGTTGWVDERNLDSGVSIRKELPQLRSSLSESREKLAAQAELIKQLTSQLEQVKELRSSELSKINEERAKQTAQVAQLENEIVRLQATIDGMDETNLMGWFLRGGALAIAGIIIGLIIPNLPKRRRRNDDWF